MFSKAKWFKHYGVPKERFVKYNDIIQQGNDTSLGAIVILDALILTVFTAFKYIAGWPLNATIIFTIIEIIIALSYFVLAKSTKRYHFIFFYLTVEVMIIFGVYAMSIESASTIFLYPAVAVLLPLFYMHNMVSNCMFFGINYIVFVLLAYLGPEELNYMQKYVVVAGAFTLVGLIIHYVYQSNRLRELINYQDSLEKQNALEISSSFDPLSKLLRRRAFIRLAEKQIKECSDDEYMILGIVDVDHFKLINDTYGHQVGDETVTVIGKVLSEELDVALVSPENSTFTLDYDYDYGNIAGRLGGDEFIFLLKTVVDIRDGKKVMQSLIDRLNRTSFGAVKSIQGSIGIVSVEKGESSFDPLYHKADIALYEAKNSGRNKYVQYEEGMTETKKEAGIDSLTGLLQDKEFKKKVVSHLSDNMGKKESIIHIDIENFKAFNAKYGFDKGDELLVKVANALRKVFKDDLMARFSSDHFVILTSTSNDIKVGVEEVKAIVNEDLPDFATILRVGVYNIDRSKPIDVSLACDNAKFACDTIRGRYDLILQYFDENLEMRRDKYQYVIEHIDEAIANNQIKIFFQPIIDVQTKEVCSLEALARWESEEYGMLPPCDFIETLEQTRLIHKLDMYVVESICKEYAEAAEMHGKDVVPISINLSQRDFEIIDVVDLVESTASKYNVPRYLLHIEITESTMTEQREHLKNVSARFEELGYEIWMDDFGSGYSSLNVLKDFMFDVIKFDMDFLKGHAARSHVILKYMINMCKELGLKTLIEGVETEEQFEFIKSIGCDYCQGYLFSKPLPKEEITEYLYQ